MLDSNIENRRSVYGFKALHPTEHAAAHGAAELGSQMAPRAVGGHQHVTEVSGEVDAPISLSWDDFRALPRAEQVSDFHCVTTWSKFDIRWSGVAFFTLAELVRPQAEVKHVLFSSYDGYTTNVRLDDVMDDDVLIATQYDGQPLPREHGGPARVIIPKLYAWKGAKFIRGIEFSAEDKLGFWEVRGYSNTADPWTEDRFS